jgi:hypothetical protein
VDSFGFSGNSGYLHSSIRFSIMEIADIVYNKDEFVETASGNKVNFKKQTENQSTIIALSEFLR